MVLKARGLRLGYREGSSAPGTTGDPEGRLAVRFPLEAAQAPGGNLGGVLNMTWLLCSPSPCHQTLGRSVTAPRGAECCVWAEAQKLPSCPRRVSLSQQEAGPPECPAVGVALP